MARYKIITLIDITRTDVRKSEHDLKASGQQQNFDSLRQAIELRSNLEWAKDPLKKDGALPEPFRGKSRFWIWEFDVEREDVFLKNGDPVALLKEDINGVPIVTGLEESIDVYPPVFKTKGEDFNTFIEII